MQTLRIVLILITLGCILGPIGTTVVIYRNNLSGMVVPPQLNQLISNNNNSNNNNGNNNDNNNNGINSNNNSNGNPTSSFGGSGQFEVTILGDGSQVSGEISSTVNCAVTQNGNNIQLSLSLESQTVPSDLQPTFVPNNSYVFNFAGSASNSDSGTQITATSQGGLSPGGPYNINFSGSIDQAQDTLTFTLTSAANSQVNISTLEAVNIYPNNNNNNNSGNNNNYSNNGNNGSNGNNNNSNGVNTSFDNASSQIDTATGKITLTFTISNSNNQDAKISKMSGTVVNNQDQVTLGTVSLQSSVTIPAGQSSQVVVSGTLSSQGKDDLKNNFAGAASIDIAITGGTMTVNGVTQSNSQTQDLGNINLVS